MVFGNSYNVRNVIASLPQEPIYAMRTTRPLSLAEITSRTGLPADEVRRFNPALADRVPPRSTLYLPSYVADFGPDVAFWRRPPTAAYAAVLDAFTRLAPGPEQWDDPSFAPVLSDFKRRSSTDLLYTPELEQRAERRSRGDEPHSPIAVVLREQATCQLDGAAREQRPEHDSQAAADPVKAGHGAVRLGRHHRDQERVRKRRRDPASDCYQRHSGSQDWRAAHRDRHQHACPPTPECYSHDRSRP